MPRKQMTRDELRIFISEQQTRLSEFAGLVQVNVSGGAASAVAWRRCLDLYGPDRVVPVFADTSSEDSDTYRFINDCETLFEQKCERLVSYNPDGSKMNIWDCFDKHRVISLKQNGGACKASIELKIRPLREHFDTAKCDAMAVGYEFLEPERAVGLIKATARTAGENRCLFPLFQAPRLSGCEIRSEVESWGLTLPALYEDGFIHNNCGGTCVLAGLGQWNAVRRKFPERFANAEERERKFRETTDFTILKDQRKTAKESGDTRYSLEQLRVDAENGREFPTDWRSNCNCMSPQLFSTEDCI